MLSGETPFLLLKLESSFRYKDYTEDYFESYRTIKNLYVLSNIELFMISLQPSSPDEFQTPNGDGIEPITPKRPRKRRGPLIDKIRILSNEQIKRNIKDVSKTMRDRVRNLNECQLTFHFRHLLQKF